MIYIALVRMRGTKETKKLEMDYPSKKAFKRDIRANGMALVHNFIYTPEEWEKMVREDREFMNWMETRLANKRMRSRISNRIKRERKASK